jgi:hypothetical protein
LATGTEVEDRQHFFIFSTAAEVTEELIREIREDGGRRPGVELVTTKRNSFLPDSTIIYSDQFGPT